MIYLATLLAEELNDRLHVVFGETRNLRLTIKTVLCNKNETNSKWNKRLRDPCHKCHISELLLSGGLGSYMYVGTDD